MAKKNLPKARETLIQKVEIQKKEKDIETIEKEIQSIHQEKENITIEELVRTTVFIPKKLLKEIKLYCIQNDLTVKDFVTNAIKEHFNSIIPG